jgi:outer membrane receptor protein involved in Fe transport
MGLQKETWTAELYVQNLTDERGVVWINAVNWDTREQVNQPRSIGVRWRQSF